MSLIISKSNRGLSHKLRYVLELEKSIPETSLKAEGYEWNIRISGNCEMTVFGQINSFKIVDSTELENGNKQITLELDAQLENSKLELPNDGGYELLEMQKEWIVNAEFLGDNVGFYYDNKGKQVSVLSCYEEYIKEQKEM